MKILPLYLSLFFLVSPFLLVVLFIGLSSQSRLSERQPAPLLPRRCSSTLHFECSFSVLRLRILPVKSQRGAKRNAWVGLLQRQVAWYLDEGACRTWPTLAERLTCYRFKSDSTSRREKQTWHSQDMNKESTNRSSTVRTIKPHATVTGRPSRVCVDECEMPCIDMRRLTGIR